MAGSISTKSTSGEGHNLIRLAATVVSDGSGVVTAKEIGSAFGRLVGVEYKPGTLATGVDLTVTDESGATVFALTNAGTSPLRFRPLVAPTDNAGVAITSGVPTDIYVAGKLLVAAAQAGATATGSLTLLIAAE